MRTFIRWLDAFNRMCAIGIGVAASACVAIMIIIVFCGVVWRYFLRDPLSWVDEMASLLLVLISFLGCYLALARKKLARIDILFSMCRGRARIIAYALSECVSLIMILIVVYYGFQLFLLPTSLRQKTPGMYIPLWLFYSLIPMTFLGNVLTTVAHILHYACDAPGDTKLETGERGGGAA